MILSKHFISFTPSDNYQLIKLIRSYYYSYDMIDLRLIDLYQDKNVFLFYISWQNHIIKTNLNWTYDEETLLISNILKRERV